MSRLIGGLYLWDTDTDSGRFSFFSTSEREEFARCADIKTRLILRAAARILYQKLPALEIREKVYWYLTAPVRENLIQYDMQQNERLGLYVTLWGNGKSYASPLWQHCLWVLSPAVVDRKIANEAFTHLFRTAKPTFYAEHTLISDFMRCGMWGHQLFEHVRKLSTTASLQRRIGYEEDFFNRTDTAFEIQVRNGEVEGNVRQDMDRLMKLLKSLPHLTQVVLDVDVPIYSPFVQILPYPPDPTGRAWRYRCADLDWVEMRHLSPFVFQLQEKGVDVRSNCVRQRFSHYAPRGYCYRDDWTLIFDPTKYNQENYEPSEFVDRIKPGEQERYLAARKRLLSHYDVYKEFERGEKWDLRKMSGNVGGTLSSKSDHLRPQKTQKRHLDETTEGEPATKRRR